MSDEEDIAMVESADETNDNDSDIATTTTPNNGIHACDVEITFPTALQAQQAMEVLQVDHEPSNRVTKSFRLGTASQPQDADTSVADPTTTMTVHFESKELKMLRVAISSFFDYLKVVLKCFQEFDTTMTADTTDTTDTTDIAATTNNDAVVVVAASVATNGN